MFKLWHVYIYYVTGDRHSLGTYTKGDAAQLLNYFGSRSLQVDTVAAILYAEHEQTHEVLYWESHAAQIVAYASFSNLIHYKGGSLV